MHVVTRKTIVDFARRHPDASGPLNAWYRAAKAADWSHIQDAHEVFPHADAIRVASGNTVTVFNIGGNKYRLVTAIHYNRRRIFILRIMKHQEYSRHEWKEKL